MTADQHAALQQLLNTFVEANLPQVDVYSPIEAMRRDAAAVKAAVEIAHLMVRVEFPTESQRPMAAVA